MPVLDAQSVLLPYELIATCESEEATVATAAEFWQAKAPWPIVMGIDFGRQGFDGVLVAGAGGRCGADGGGAGVVGMSTPEQVAMLRPRLERARRVCLDYTGPGIGMGDYLVKEFQEWKPCEHKYWEN